MSIFRLVLRSFWHYRRHHLGALAGAALASAVLTGALLVGDSVKASLRRFALQRLGPFESALQLRHRTFPVSLADRLQEQQDLAVAPAALMQGIAMTEGDESLQVNQVQVIGVGPRFWMLSGSSVRLEPGSAALNEKLARALGVGVGDEVSLRVARQTLLPMDAPLAVRSDRDTVRRRFTVATMLPEDAMGRFSLTSGQTAPYNVFVPLESPLVQHAEENPEPQANTLLAGEGISAEELNRALGRVLELNDAGLRFRTVGSVIQLESKRIYFDPEMARAALAIPGARGTLSYLVSSVEHADRSTPYSFLTAGAVPPELNDDEMLVHPWLAEQVQVGVGDTVRLRYAALKDNNRFEQQERAFTVAGIADPQKMTRERDLVPPFPGLTDVNRCSDWDLGMPLDQEKLVDEANEQYWQTYGTTPKALVTLAAGQAMWGNHYGRLTAVRWSGDGVSVEALRRTLRKTLDPVRMGWVFQPVRRQALQAVEQALDFGQLFLGMSFFLIVTALMLAALLFSFGLQHRSVQWGTLLALGWPRRRVRRLMLWEGSLLALLGALLGAWGGVGYTRFLIWGLGRTWQGAVAHAAITYHAEPGTFALGAGAGFLCALGSMALAGRKLLRRPARDLLNVDVSLAPAYGGTASFRHRLVLPLSLIALLVAAATSGIAWQRGADLVMPFFTSGALLLLAGLGWSRLLLDRLQREEADGVPRLRTMALRNAARRPGRSMTVIALLACGSFLVFAVGSMQEDVTAHADEAWSGTGGMALFGESTLPMVEEDFVSSDASIIPIKVHDGDDASCLNLNHALSPRLLGLPVEALSARKAFLKHRGGQDLWRLLQEDLPGGEIPALAGDADTLTWGLKMKAGPERGDVLTYVNEDGEDLRVKLVGSLPMRLSVFQGTLLISEEHFIRNFPSEEGFRMVLLDVPPGRVEETARVWNRRHERAGLLVRPAVERLKEFYVVETTYLAMFLVLGALGLLVGSLGMGVVVLRNGLERRRENAVLQALGYTLTAVRGLVLREHRLLLVLGLGVGVVSAGVAMIPTLVSSGSQVSLPVQVLLLSSVVVCAVLSLLVAVRLSLRGRALDALRRE